MTHLFLSIYGFFSRRKWLLLLITVVSTAVLAWLASGLVTRENITAFIPDGEKPGSPARIMTRLKANEKIILMVRDVAGKTDYSSITAFADKLESELNRKFVPGLIRDITNRISAAGDGKLYDLFYENIPLFLNDSDYRYIDQITEASQIDTLIRSHLHTLLTPAGSLMQPYISRDPLGLTKLAAIKTAMLNSGGNFIIRHDHLFSKDGKVLLMVLSTTHSSGESSVNGRLLQGIDRVIAEVKNLHGNNFHVSYFGAAAVAAGNASRMKKDTMITLSLALVLILITLWFFFRSKRVLVYILLPVIFGALFSMAMIFLIKGSISVIAIGAGSVILGIAINYSLHFYTHHKHTPSVRNVIRDLANPLTIGSATTIGAFAGLLFVKSEALRDFGLFAALCLVGAALFTLIVLPFLTTGKKKQPHEERITVFEKISSLRPDKNKYLILFMIILTVFFSLFAGKAGFESDMEKMNYMHPEIAAAGAQLEAITDSSVKAVYVVSSGKDLNEALYISEAAEKKADSLKTVSGGFSYTGISALLPSDSLRAERIRKWEAYWNEEKRKEVREVLGMAGLRNSFTPGAFDEFFRLTEKEFSVTDTAFAAQVSRKLLSEYISSDDGRILVVSILRAQANVRNHVVSELRQIPGITVIDKQEMATVAAAAIKDDFNTVLLISSLLVLGFLLISYGRIELALLAFIPMVISWIWILGIMGLTGLKFNVVSIIISTFIFGLGDDFSIFITDGVLNRFSKGRDLLSSYKTAVLLSAVTTIAGIGVLVFAQHPALRSIALTTIIGMITVVIVSHTLAPALFSRMTKLKGRNRKFPVTLGGVIYAIICYGYFFTGSTLTLITGILLKVLPVGKKLRIIIFRKLLQWVSASTLQIMFLTKKRFINFNKNTFRNPALIICNHQSLIDIPLALMLHPKIIMLTNDWVWKSPLIGWLVKHAGFSPVSDGYDVIAARLEPWVKQGYSVLMFPEGTRSADQKIKRFHKGAFYLAEKLQLDILPVMIHGTGDYVAKGELLGKRSTITVEALSRICRNDKSFGTGLTERTRAIQAHFRKEYHRMTEYYRDTKYYRDLLIRNFIYKGPILEWYVRIKIRLENYYRSIHKLLPEKGKIVNLGCGHGYMDYLLAWASVERQITGVDYDGEKILIAHNGISKPANTRFVHADVRSFELPVADAFILSDVLHYMKRQEQEKVLKGCMDQLSENGVILIRDADSAMQRKHLGAKLTEFFSLNLGFNKSENKLQFISGNYITELAAEKGFSVSRQDSSKLTSNTLFILKRKS
jgi:uncharacterized protein